MNLERIREKLDRTAQVNPAMLTRASPAAPAGARMATGSAASTQDLQAPASATDQILADPGEAYRTEVTKALKDAMLDHSSSLSIAPDEWLTIAAKGNEAAAYVEEQRKVNPDAVKDAEELLRLEATPPK